MMVVSTFQTPLRTVITKLRAASSDRCYAREGSFGHWKDRLELAMAIITTTKMGPAEFMLAL
jgi:hypothetical protein